MSESKTGTSSTGSITEEPQTANQPAAEAAPDLQEQDNAKEVDNVTNNKNSDVIKTEVKNAVVEKSDPKKELLVL